VVMCFMFRALSSCDRWGGQRSRGIKGKYPDFFANPDLVDRFRTNTPLAVNPIRVSKLVKLSQQRLSVGGALRCTVTSPQYQPKGCGLEFTVTPVYPRNASSVHGGS
jgi:hypothetical protein